MKKTVRIGTRGSKLALLQAYTVKKELEQQFTEIEFVVEIIKTKGDKILDVPLSKIGDKGLFTKELEIAMFNHEIDMAVHSLKDLPTSFPEGARLGAVLKRGEIRDALISFDNRKLSDLTVNDIIATSSLRRKAQLLRINKDFKIIEIRGNVNTRIRKMQDGYCNVMVMAAAGLQRLDLDKYISELIDLETMIPACSQGAIAIEIRDDDPFIDAMVNKINDPGTRIAVDAERSFLRTLEGGCQIPVGSFTRIEGDQFHLTGFISSVDGSQYIKESIDGPVDQAVELSVRLATSLFSKGGNEILKSIRDENLQYAKAWLPLKDKVIISTRALEPGDTLPDLLKVRGAKVLALPMIGISQSKLRTDEKELMKNLEVFDWIFFTSKNGVINFFRHLIEINGNTELPKSVKMAVMGARTAVELDYYGYAPHFINEENTSDDLVQLFMERHKPLNLKILLALGSLADDLLFDRLSIDNKVYRINVYKTVSPDNADKGILEIIKRDKYDLILFTSPSTFNHFCSFYEEEKIGKLKMVSIGATTTKAINDAGYEPLFTAQKSNAEGLRDAIIEYYQTLTAF
jgi:hydroxymethylbilane synthase